MEVKDKKIVITGCNKGIGLAVATRLAQAGAHLMLLNRKLDLELESTLLQKGAASVRTFAVDLSDRESLNLATAEIKKNSVDILFNNAGLLTGGLLEEQPLNDIYKMFQVNVNALVQLSQAVLPSMVARKSGKIINHSSVSALMHFPCATTYAASKAAVLAFTNCLRAELKGTGVTTLTLITPGIKTKMFDQISDLYGKNFEVPQDSISPKVYADMIFEAILVDLPVLNPSGVTGLALGLARHLPRVFEWGVLQKFKR